METFYPQWIIEEECLLNDLLSIPPNRPDLHISLISRALSHYAKYYDRLSQLADQDIYLVLSAYWLTPVERSFFWHGGLKPDILFHFSPLDLNDYQNREIEKLRQQTLHRETELEVMMREVELTMMALVATEAVHGSTLNEEARAEAEMRVTEIMRMVFLEADRLRKHVVARKLKVLNTAQTVRFLAMVTNYQIWTRRLGLCHIAQS
jgi:transcription factor TGA